MKIDPYTKIVLTVIAISLLVIAGQSFIPDAIAAGYYKCSGDIRSGSISSISHYPVNQTITFMCFNKG